MFPRRVLSFVFALHACLLVIAPAFAFAEGPFAIPPGREEIILGVVQAAFAPGRVHAIDVQKEIIIVRTVAEGPKLVAHHPSAAPIPGELSAAVALDCGRPCTEAERGAWKSAAAAFAGGLRAAAHEIWTPRPRARSSSDRPRAGSSSTMPRWLSIGLMALALLLAIWPPWDVGRARWSALLRSLWPALVLGGFSVGLSLTLTSVMPLHEHLSFIMRWECAALWTCDRALGAWSAPTFHVLGALASPFSYAFDALAYLSLGLGALSLVLLYAVSSELAAHAGSGADTRVAALFATGLVALHPLYFRVAAAATFWPYAVCCVLGAALMWFRVGRTGSRSAAVAAGLFFGFALASSRLNFVLAPLGVLAVVASLRRGRASEAAWGLGSAGLVLGPVGLDFLREGDPYGVWTDVLSPSGLAERYLAAGSGLTEFDLTPVVVLLFCGVGVAAFMARSAWVWAFLYAFVSVSVGASMVGGAPSSNEPPSFYIKHFSPLFYAAPLFGVGVAWVVGHFRRGPRLAMTAGIAISTLLLMVSAPGARWLATGDRVLEREFEGIVRSLDALPDHDLLVIPPSLILPAPGVLVRGDPIEVYFPKLIYRRTMRRRGMLVPSPIHLPEFVESPRQGKVLLYVGSALRSFYRDEVAKSLVPDTLERPALANLRRRYELRPAITFHVSAAEHPAVDIRLGADRSPSLPLGFHWLVPR